MESTKIPKPSKLKPPSQLPAPGVRSLATIQEKKVSSACAAPPPRVDQRKHFLRRRSKSVTDLRPTSAKTMPATGFFNEKPPIKPSVKTAGKRPLEGKSDEENKPKLAKTKKIPDWDYKSRFQELQKKHITVVGELKNARSKLEDLQLMETQMQTLQCDNKKKHADLESLKTSLAVSIKEKQSLTEEYNRIKSELSDLYTTYFDLKTSHDTIKSDNECYVARIDSIEKENMQVQSDYKELQATHMVLQTTTDQLTKEIMDHENVRRVLHNTIQDLKGNIRVFCRVRPAINTEEREKLQCSMSFPDESCMEIRKSRESVSTITGKPTDLKQEFNFDKVFPPEAKQPEVFEELAQLVQSALDGYHVCVFAYGQTGSGKTYTMQGTEDNQGMIPRSIDLLFERIAQLSILGWTYDVLASFLEVYNESIKDLLAPNSSLAYEPRYNEGRGVTVTNLQTIPITSAANLKKLVDDAQKNRAVAATDFNLHSSRSHSITKITLEGHNKHSQITFCGSIHLVDLAGSESAKTSSGERLTETKSINRSLTELGKVMLALHNKEAHVSYRNSKLTYLLQSCLGGNSKTLMFVNICPFEECYNESINSLRFGARVKEVKMRVKKNKAYAPSLT